MSILVVYELTTSSLLEVPGVKFCFCSNEESCRFCVDAQYRRDTCRLPVEQPSFSHRGYAWRRKRARRDPQMIEFWCPDNCGNPSPALARARAYVRAEATDKSD